MSEHYDPVKALANRIDGTGGLRQRMEDGDVTPFETDVVLAYDAMRMSLDGQATEIERLRNIEEAAKQVRATHPYDHRRVVGLCDCSLCGLNAALDGGKVGDAK